MSYETKRNIFRRQSRSHGHMAPESGILPLGVDPGLSGHRDRRWPRILLVAAGCVALLITGAVGGSYLYVNNYLSSIHRIHGIAALTAANRPAMPAATRNSMTILMMSIDVLPPCRHGKGKLGSCTVPQGMAGLISLLHIDADRQGASMTSIPPNALVKVPHHGRMELWKTLTIGGPSLLIRTVMQLTHVRIDHFAVVDFAGVKSVIRAIHGVDVLVATPFANDGFYFHKGVNHLGPDKALAYARLEQGVSQIGRGELQQSLIRAFARKASNLGPSATMHVAKAVTAVLSLDSNFTNAELMKLTFQLRNMPGSDTIWINAPTTNGSPVTGGVDPVRLDKRITSHLWQAIRHDRVQAFARRYPFTLTPLAPF